MTPTIKVTLSHNSGAVSVYKPAAPLGAPNAGGLREAIITCIAGAPGDLFNRVDLLRSDMAGADWVALVNAKAVPELEARLKKAAVDLMAGFEPHIVVTLSENRSLTDARLVTSADDLAKELADEHNRALVVPRILPYQLGGNAEGASAVLYSPAGGKGIKVYSMHPTEQEARMSEQTLKDQGEKMTTTMKVTTAVTALVAQVARGEFKPALSVSSSANAIVEEAERHTALRRPGMPPVRPGTPSPFAEA